MPHRYRLLSLRATPLRVPLVEPFLIASGRVDETPNALVEVVVRDEDRGTSAVGLGEAATLPPVTRETLGDVLAALAALPPEPLPLDDAQAAVALAAAALPDRPCARAGLETALLDAFARLAGVPLRALLAPGAATVDRLTSDITVPIATPGEMSAGARRWRALGFTCFKVKVGRDLDGDMRALEALHRAVPDATFRIDANAGFTAAEALTLARAADRLGLAVECYEQPCARGALDEMAEVAAALDVPVVADESLATEADLDALLAARAADGINLKLAKCGGPTACLALGRRARAHGLRIMVGGMVETRLGMTAAAHLAAALGGVDWPDLDTAWLLVDDPFTGGYTSAGPRITLPESPGLAIELRGGRDISL